jgi:hypothetical protein
MRLVLFAALAGPLAWSTHNLLSVGLVPVACGLLGMWVLHALTALTAALSASGVVVGLVGDVHHPGQRFAVNTGILLDSFFVLVILAEGIPNFVLNPCLS